MEISYRVVESRRRTLALQVLPDGGVVVRCPKGFPRSRVAAFVESKRSWLERQLVRLPREEKLSAAALENLRKQAQQDLSRRAALFWEKMGISYGRITVRSQRTRWGSCTGRGNLSFNCLLMLAPEGVRDYVVVHELCHRRQMNHSKAFWAEVEGALPDYGCSRKWLRENGPRLLAQLPEK